MLSDPPFFSIFIPTKSRPQYVGESIQSVLLQDFDNFELVVSNNGADSSVRNEVSIYTHDKRLKYVEQPQLLGMPQHWETVTRSLIGKYIIIVTDRFLLKKSSLSFLYSVLAQGNAIDVITWPWSMYYSDKKILHESKVLYNSNPSLDNIIEVNSENQLLNMAKGHMNENFFLLPRGLNSCVSNSFIKALRNKYSSIFRPINPDHTFGYLCLHNTDKTYHINFPLSISRGVEVSNGHKHYYTYSEDYINEVGIKEPFCDVPIKLAFVLNTIHADFLSIAKLDKNDKIVNSWNKVAYYKDCIIELDAKKTEVDTDIITALEQQLFFTIRTENLSTQFRVKFSIFIYKLKLVIRKLLVFFHTKNDDAVVCNDALQAAKFQKP